MLLRTVTVMALTLVSVASSAIAGNYHITWKSDLPEGTVNRCDIKITGSPALGPTTTLKNWEGVNFPLDTFAPADFNKKISYSPASGCARLDLNIACHSKPEGSDWRQGLTISPCQDRTIRMHVDGVRLE